MAPDDPSPEDLSEFLLEGAGAVIPACTSINSLYIRPLSQSAAELVAHLPARACEEFGDLLEQAVIQFCTARDGPPRSYAQPVYFDRPVTMSTGTTAPLSARKGSASARLPAAGGASSVHDPREALAGEFTLWVPKHDLPDLKDGIYNAYRDVVITLRGLYIRGANCRVCLRTLWPIRAANRRKGSRHV